MLLYNTSCNYDWSCVLNENSVDCEVYNFAGSVSKAVTGTIPCVNPEVLTGFLNLLYIRLRRKTNFYEMYVIQIRSSLRYFLMS